MNFNSSTFLLASALAFASPASIAQSATQRAGNPDATTQLMPRDFCGDIQSILAQYPTTPVFRVDFSKEKEYSFFSRWALLRSCGMEDPALVDSKPSSRARSAKDGVAPPEWGIFQLNEITRGSTLRDPIVKDSDYMRGLTLNDSLNKIPSRDRARSRLDLFDLGSQGEVYKKSRTYQIGRKPLSDREIEEIFLGSQSTQNLENIPNRRPPQYSPSPDGYSEPLNTANSPCVARIGNSTRIQWAVVIGDNIVACNR